MNSKAFNPQLFQATEEGLVHSKKERERRQNPGPLNQPKLNPGKAFQDKLVEGGNEHRQLPAYWEPSKVSGTRPSGGP